MEDTNKNTPVQLIDVAIDAKKQGSPDEVVWVVFDRESESKYSHELHVQEMFEDMKRFINNESSVRAAKPLHELEAFVMPILRAFMP